MSNIGYARVSKEEQNLDLQISELKRHGCEVIFQEKKSAGSLPLRIEFKKMLNYLRKGDTLVCWKIDRIGRNAKEVCMLVDELEKKGINITSTSDGINIQTPLGKAFVQISAIFAEMERNYIRERTLAGLEEARSRGVKLGRPRGLSPVSKENKVQCCMLFDKGFTVSEISKILKISRPTVYRYVGETVNND